MYKILNNLKVDLFYKLCMLLNKKINKKINDLQYKKINDLQYKKIKINNVPNF